MYFLGLQVDGLITWGAFKWCEGGGGGLIMGCIFLFTGRWAYNWEGYK